MKIAENRVEDDYEIHSNAKDSVFPVYLLNEKLKKNIVSASSSQSGFVLVSGPAAVQPRPIQ